MRHSWHWQYILHCIFCKMLFTIVHHGNLKLELHLRTRSNGISWNWLHVRLTDFDYPSISWILIFEFVVFKFPFLSHKIYVCSGEDSEWKTHLMNRNDAVSILLSRHTQRKWKRGNVTPSTMPLGQKSSNMQSRMGGECDAHLLAPRNPRHWSTILNTCSTI